MLGVLQPLLQGRSSDIYDILANFNFFFASDLHHPISLAFGGFFLQDDSSAASLQLDHDQGVVQILPI